MKGEIFFGSGCVAVNFPGHGSVLGGNILLAQKAQYCIKYFKYPLIDQLCAFS